MRASELRKSLCDEEAPPVDAAELRDVSLQQAEEPAAAPTVVFPFSDSSPTVYVSVTTAPPGQEPAPSAEKAEKARSILKADSFSGKPAAKEVDDKEYDQEKAHDEQQRRNMAANKLRKPRAQSVFYAPFQNLTLLEFDVETYGEDWYPNEKKYFALCAMAHLVWFFIMLLRVTNFDGNVRHIPEPVFWARQAAMLGSMCAVFAFAGLLTTTTNFHSGYSRKICHLALFASTPVTMFLWPYHSSSPAEARWATLWTVWTSFLPYYGLLKPLRRRLTFALLAFRAIDREEDRPHTLEWLISQAVAGLAAIVGIMMFLSSSVRQDADDKGARLMLVMIPILINGVGDGLAEPVGIRFGKHKYKTRALWYQGRCCSGSFTRSFEGSACVFLSGVFAVGMFRLFYSDVQFGVAMGAIPLALTLAEAWSPHTWDTPFIIGVGGVILGLIERLLPGCGDACVNKISFFGIH